MNDPRPGLQTSASPPPANASPSRRRWLTAAALGLASRPWHAAIGAPLPIPGAGAGPVPTFGLGVASGCLGSDRVLLWTRLVPGEEPASERPMADAGGGAGLGNRSFDVHWTLASDPGMRRPVAKGTVNASAGSAHAVRVAVDGLAPDRWYWYRFATNGAQSRVGRTRTMPAPGAAAARLRIAVASCQNYEHGHYAAWRHIVADEPDLVVHVGDYIYEATWGRNLVRPLGLPEARDLAGYRQRYEIYRRDPDLQAAHAAVPWAVVWDDHEVMNDYAGLLPERQSETAAFPRRRAEAYQAWFEHMPVPSASRPGGGGLRVHRALTVGNLLTLYLLDGRQYRSLQACAPAGRNGGNVIEAASCAALADPDRTMLGGEQERWLDRALGRSRSTWNLLAQQTLMSPLAVPGNTDSVHRTRTDGWDGYPPARQRLVDSLVGRRVANPVIVGGDLHAFHVADLPAAGPGSTTVAAEVVGTSITSQAADQAFYDRLRAANEHLRYANGTQRGYLRLTVDRQRTEADLVGLADVRRADSTAAVQAAWVVEAGRAGVQRA